MTVAVPSIFEPPRLSVLTATPPGFNPGMVATELALRSFLDRHGWQSVARIYRMVSLTDRLQHIPPEHRSAIERQSHAGLEFQSTIDNFDSIAESSAILFWADFLHMAQYNRAIRNVAITCLGIDNSSAADLISKLFLFDGVEDVVLERTMSFGTTLLFNTLQDEMEDQYGASLRRMLSKIRRVWVRDAMSAARVAHLRGDYRSGYFGIDAALLLRREHLSEDLRAGSRRPGSILVFLARDVGLREKMMEVAQRMSDVLRKPLFSLPLGGIEAFPALSAAAMPLAVPASSTAEELLHEVAEATLVITDTYHLAMMAWNLGVPAIASFVGYSSNPTNVSNGREFNWRDKREMLYSQYDALEFLVRPEELLNQTAFEKRLVRLAEVVQDRVVHSAIIGRMHAHATIVELDLAGEISALLAGR